MLSHFSLTEEILVKKKEKAFILFYFIFVVMQILTNIKKFSKFYPDLSFYFPRFYFFFPACSFTKQPSRFMRQPVGDGEPRRYVSRC